MTSYIFLGQASQDGTIQNETEKKKNWDTTYCIGVRESPSLLFGIDQLSIDSHLKVPRISDTPRHLCPSHVVPHHLRQGIVTRGVPSSTTINLK